MINKLLWLTKGATCLFALASPCVLFVLVSCKRTKF
jgi:hypothetical protein